jgi:hypothetical protein
MLKSGAAFANITPKKPHFLFGYPFVERMSTGVNDWLLSSALYLTDSIESIIFITNDIIHVNKSIVSNVRKAVSEATGIPGGNIMIGATHTHSGPITVDCMSSSNDPVVPPADPEYVHYLEQQIILSACAAVRNAVPAKVGLTVADGTGIGTNRHIPDGPADLDMPVLVVKDLEDNMIACMMICNMHPTVLHEDSTLYSGDFPAYARDILQKKVFGCECPVLHFTGAAGNQSPRHVTRSNTFGEAARIGGIIATSVKRKLDAGIEFDASPQIFCSQALIDLPRRVFPDVEWATSNRDKTLERFQSLKKTSGNVQEIRTAEVDWFGAEELLFLSKQAANGNLESAFQTSLPAEIQIIRIGVCSFVSWPGEVFVEYALELKKKYANTWLVTLTNGELQGYIATKEAEEKNYYEASNSLFHYSSGEVLLSKTVEMLTTNH